MTSALTQAMTVNAAVLASVLATDLGPARKIGTARILRPLAVAAIIVPIFLATPATHGTGLALEIAGAALGMLCGLAAITLMRVHRSPETGKPVSRAGTGYAALWTAIIAARAAFSYGAVHWFPTQLVNWAITNKVTEAAITDALVFMAITMLLTRTLGIWRRAATLPPTSEPTSNRTLHAHA